MSKKKLNKKINRKSIAQPLQEKGTQEKSKPYKKYITYLSYLINVVLILLSLYSYYPSIVIQPLPYYFDGRDNWQLLELKSSTFIPLRDIQVFTKYNILDIQTSEGSIRIAGSVDALLPIEDLSDNPVKTVSIRGINIGNSGSIVSVRESNFLINVTYKLPFLPFTFGKSVFFFATKNDDYSIRWHSM